MIKTLKLHPTIVTPYQSQRKRTTLRETPPSRRMAAKECIKRSQNPSATTPMRHTPIISCLCQSQTPQKVPFPQKPPQSSGSLPIFTSFLRIHARPLTNPQRHRLYLHLP